jgi:hypothetical protein
MSLGEERIKGAIVVHYLDAAEKRLGREAYDALLASISPPMQAAAKDVHASAWVPEALLVELIGKLVERHGADVMRAIAHAQQMAMSKRTHVFFSRIAGPKNLVRMAARVWSQFRDGGDARAEMLGDNGARLVVRDRESLRAPGCAESFAASCVAALELTRAKNVRASCDVQADAVTFDFRWD